MVGRELEENQTGKAWIGNIERVSLRILQFNIELWKCDDNIFLLSIESNEHMEKWLLQMQN